MKKTAKSEKTKSIFKTTQSSQKIGESKGKKTGGRGESKNRGKRVNKKESCRK